MIQTLKIIITGVITGLKIGAGVGMGVVFGSRILSVYRNLSHPKERSQFFNYALLGFTYTEAAGLFALICLFILVYFSILFVFALFLPWAVAQGRKYRSIYFYRSRYINSIYTFYSIFKP
jgi:F-type H+-transporting ATPase subunit c